MDRMPSFTYQRFQSRADARSAFDTAIESATNRIALFERDGDFYGLDRPLVAERLGGLLRASPDNRVDIVVQRTHFIQRDCPRLMMLVQRFGSRLSICRLKPEFATFERGFALIDKVVVLRRPHFDRSVVFWDVDDQQIAGANRLFQDLLDNCEPPLSVPVTGL
ncbi:MAG: hypothetical protein R3E68_09210 [Burkholderiaceae bacterium]